MELILSKQEILHLPNSTDDTAIPAPQGDDASFTIVQSNGSTDTAVMDELTAWHMSMGALDSFVAPDSDWGHYMTTIDGGRGSC